MRLASEMLLEIARMCKHPGVYFDALTYTADALFRHGIARRFLSGKPTVYAQESRDGSGRKGASVSWRRAGIHMFLPECETSRKGRESVTGLPFNN